MLVIALSRLSLLPHLPIHMYLIMTAHTSRIGCDVSNSIVVCLIDGWSIFIQRFMSSGKTILSFADGFAIKVTADRVRRRF